MDKEIKYSFLILVSTLSWGSTFPLIKIALEYMSPVIFLSVRFAISSLMMLPFIKNPKDFTGFKEGMIAGFFLFLGYYFQTIGLYFTTPAISGLLTGLYVVLVPIFSLIVYRTHVLGKDWLAAFLSLLGLIIISLGQISNSSVQIGDLLTVICAVGYAFQILYVAKHNNIEMTKFTFYQMISVFIFSTILIPTFKIYANFQSPQLIFSLVFTALFAGVIAYVIANRSLIYVRAERATVIMASEPIFAAAFSVLITGIPLSDGTLVGGTLMVISIFLVTIRAGKT
ncbi:DMT family transporter [Caldiplasma sukawensis]